MIWIQFEARAERFFSPILSPQALVSVQTHVKWVARASSSSAGPMANSTDVLQPSRLIVLTLSPPACLDVPTFAYRCPHVPNNARDPSSERWNYVGKN